MCNIVCFCFVDLVLHVCCFEGLLCVCFAHLVYVDMLCRVPVSVHVFVCLLLWCVRVGVRCFIVCCALCVLCCCCVCCVCVCVCLILLCWLCAVYDL